MSDPKRIVDRLTIVTGRLATAERHMEALLNTLSASSHPWIVKVYRNAKAAWENRHAQ